MLEEGHSNLADQISRAVLKALSGLDVNFAVNNKWMVK
jgi:hypothetical protein